ncbi:MAG: DUF6600 domain-containing protein [Nitrospirota bacterium]
MRTLSRRTIPLLGALLSIFLLSCFASRASADAGADSPDGLGMARVTFIQGDGSFNGKDTNSWAALSPNFSLQNGDRLWAGDNSKIEVQFSGGHMAWLNYQTELDITDMENAKGLAIQVGLASGEASFATRPMGRNDVFQVDTPNASVRAYDKARFRVTVLGDGTTQIGVSSGKVELESTAGLSDINQGEMVEIEKDGSVNTGTLPGKDGWDQWVDARWERYVRPSRSARYLPPAMDDYGYEFDEGGHWIDNPGYGNVWVPSVGPAWSPYSNGRWVWVNGDYTWLPYDPFYACFHYGRWSWSLSTGWFWLPPAPSVGVWWSPGYVGWAWSGGFVSWVPLAPGELYYGYGYYGPQSVNINITHVTVIKNVYINSRVNNAVVVVNRHNFLRGDPRRVAISGRQNPFIHPGAMGARVMPGTPARAIKPIKASRFPRPGVRPKHLPPARIQKVIPMLRKRAIARSRGASAFRPGGKPTRVPFRELGKRAPARKPGIAPARRPAPLRPGIKGQRPGAANVPGGKPWPKTKFNRNRPAPPGRRVAPARERGRLRQPAPQERKGARPAIQGKGRTRIAPERKAAPSGWKFRAPGSGTAERPAPPTGRAPKAGRAATTRPEAPVRERRQVNPAGRPAPRRASPPEKRQARPKAKKRGRPKPREEGQ